MRVTLLSFGIDYFSLNSYSSPVRKGLKYGKWDEERIIVFFCVL